MKHRLRCAILLLAASVGQVASPANAQDSFADAQREFNAGRFSRAVDMLTDAAIKSPDDARVHFLLGQCYYDLHEFSRAVTSLERSVQLAPNQSEYHDWLGKAYGRRAEESVFLGAMSWARKSHKEFETAVQLNPSNFEAQRDLIRFEMYAPGMVSGGDDKAMQHIEALEKIDAIEGKAGSRRIPHREETYGGSGSCFRRSPEISERSHWRLLRSCRLLSRPPGLRKNDRGDFHGGEAGRQ